MCQGEIESRFKWMLSVEKYRVKINSSLIVRAIHKLYDTWFPRECTQRKVVLIDANDFFFITSSSKLQVEVPQ